MTALKVCPTSIIPHGVGVEASFSLVRNDIRWRQSKTTGETFRERAVATQFVQASNGIFAGSVPSLDTAYSGNDSDMKRDVKESKLHWMAKVHNFLEMWQGSQNLCATQKESHDQNMPMTDIEFILYTEEIFKVSSSLFQPDGLLHLNCQKDHLCHQLCLQMICLEDKLKYWMSGKWQEWTVIQSKAVRLAHLKVFQTPDIGSTGMATWIIQLTAMTNVRQNLNLI